MNIYTKIFIFILFIVVCKGNLYSQSFSVGSLDVSNFPTVRTVFLALQANSEPYSGLTRSDFIIQENGNIIPENKVQVICGDIPMSIVMVFDISTSMNDEIDGKKLIDIVKAGGTNFINQINFNTGTRVAITSFAGRNYLNTPKANPFLNVQSELINTLNQLQVVNGTTNFNAAFLNETSTADGGAIELLNSVPPNHQKVIVFLTDGRHETMSAVLKKDYIIQELNKNSIKLYSITFMDQDGANSQLSDMSNNTGGKYYFENNPNALGSVYNQILNDLRKQPNCNLLWEGRPACDATTGFRQVQITFKKQSNANVLRYYNVPTDKYVYIDKSEFMYSFGNPDLGEYFDNEVKITPRLHNMLVENVEIVPPDYFDVDWGKGFGKTFSQNDKFTIAQDKEFTFKIRYTPQDEQKLRQAMLVISGDPCPTQIPLIGGQAKISVVPSIYGEVYSACEDIEIQWEGIEQGTRVNIDAYNNITQQWERIASNRLGSSYTWTPPLKDGEYSFRVSAVSTNELKWARRIGGTQNDFVTSIDVQENGQFNYISGYYSGSINTGNKVLSSVGGTDGFIAKFDSNGNPVWSSNIGSQGNDRANGLVLDPAGNAFVTGYCFTGARFDNNSPYIQAANRHYLFLAKYRPNGQVDDVKVFGVNNSNSNIEFRGDEIKYHYLEGMAEPVIFVKGTYRGNYKLVQPNIQLSHSNNWRQFVAIFDTKLNLIDMYAGLDNTPGYTNLTAFDLNGDLYTTGTFVNQRNYQSITLNSVGGTDIYIDRHRPVLSTTDVSEPIKVIVPQLEFTINELDLGDIIVGDTLDIITELILTNNTQIPIEIKDLYFDEILGNGFWQLHTIPDPEEPENEIIDLIGIVMEYQDTISLRFKHTATGFSIFSVNLTVVPDCGYAVSLPINSIGVCKALVVSPIEFEPTYLGEQSIITKEAIVCNPNKKPISIQPLIRSDGHPSDDVYWHYFEILTNVSQAITIQPDSCFTLTIAFKPTKEGLKTAYIDYRSNLDCTVPITILQGLGITNKVTINDIDWGEKRVNGTYQGKLVISNPSNVNHTILDIEYSDLQAMNSFNLQGLPQTPFQIPAYTTLEYDVWFEPIDEVNYNTAIILTVSNHDDPVIGYLNGTGILPKMDVEWLCSSPILKNIPSDVFLTISNPSQSADLYINSIELSNTDEYNWKNGSAPSNIIIPKGSNEIFEILLIALDGTEHNTDVLILADDFDGTFTEEWKTTITEYSCDILTINLNDLDFNNILICENHYLPILIENSSDNTPLTLFVNSSQIIGPDADWFSLDLNIDVTIPPNSSIEVNVIFSPTEARHYVAELSIANSANAEMQAELSGSGVHYVLTSTKTEYTLMPGKHNKQKLNIAADLSLLDNVYVNELELHIEYNSFAINFDLNSFSSLINLGNNENWTWNPPRYEIGGNLYISGSGQLQTPLKERVLFMLDIYAYLSEYDLANINITVNYNCTNIEHLTIPVEIEKICAYDLRMVTVGANEFTFGTPKPNPSSTNFSIEYSIGYDIPTSIKIYDIMGNELETILDTVLSGGTYNLTITTENIPSGIYYIRMQSGHFTETRQLNIVK